MPENFANRYTTTLAAGVTSGDLTGTVTTATGAPAVPFRAIISAEGANTDEIVLVTGRTGTTLTWTRAAEAIAGVQVASAHGTGAVLTAIVTAAGLLNASVFDVRAYGAAGDGVADDTAAVAAAIAAAAAAGGGEVAFGNGTFMASSVVLKSNVTLVGASPTATTLMQPVGTDATFVTLETVDTEFAGMRSLTVHGNSFTSGGITTGNTAGGGIYLDNTAGVFTYSDPYHLFRDVFVVHCAGDAWGLTSGVRASTFDNCRGRLSSRGWSIAGTDNTFLNSHGETNAKAGFFVAGGNNHFDACKAFSNGYAMVAAGDEGDGFLVSHVARNVFTNCASQDNHKNGVVVLGSECIETVWTGASDSNSVTTLTAAAGYRLDACTGVRIIGTTGNQRATQDYGVVLANAASANIIQVVTDSNLSGRIATTGAAAANDVVIDGNGGGIEPVTFASPYVPNPAVSLTKMVTLTGPLSVSAVLSANRWTGARLRFVFVQDGVGGRVVTFNAAYKTAWTPDTTAGKTNVIEFIYDGTSWLQTAAAVGL